MTVNYKKDFRPSSPITNAPQSGFTLIELMIAITISLIIMLALITVFINLSRSNAEMAKTNAQIENGRFAIQLLQNDIIHAGFWSSYVPQFDDLSSRAVPALASTTDGTVPTAVPDPCLAYSAANWNAEYKANLLGIPVQGYDTVPASCATVLPNQKADTDVIVVRHADTCVVGAPGCEANIAGNLYFQASLCSSTAQAGGANTITLSSASSAVAADYVGKTIRIIAGTGTGQSRTITAYDGTTKVATVDSNWATGKIPDNTSSYSLDAVNYVFDTAGHTSTNRNCTTIADLRKFVSNIYYIRNFALTEGDGIPTLMRSQFGLAGSPAALQQQNAVELIEGIEGFRVEYGIDNLSDTGGPVNYTQAVDWADTTNLTSPTNRGDGIPDQYVRCPTANTAADDTPPSTHPAATVCTVAELSNVVTVKLFVLARNRDITPGHVDNKTYRLGSTTLGPFNDNFKRHVFSTTVRVVNVSGRRETP
jgi:prepilin-type N-terminal cleavage/methylation domain-containing protein